VKGPTNEGFTYNTTENVTFVRIFVPEPEVYQHSSLVHLDRIAVGRGEDVIAHPEARDALV